MNIHDLEGKKIGVLGVGTEGLALVQFLSGNINSPDLTVLDALSRNEIEKRLEGKELDDFCDLIGQGSIKSFFGADYLDSLNDFDVIFRSPGISFFNDKIQDALKSGVTISSQIKLFFDLCPCLIIGVTGTKGKGTTSSLIFQIMKKWLLVSSQQSAEGLPTANCKPQTYLAGNIGYPAITLIPDLKKYDVVILELSSFQLMDLEKSPHVGVVTNLTVDHLNYHKDLAEYRDSKKAIFRYQGEDDFSIINSGSSFEGEFVDGLRSKKLTFGEGGGDAIISNIDGIDSVVLDPSDRNIKICDLNSIKLLGRHNLENISAAVLACDAMGVDVEVMKEVISDYKGLPHRLEMVRVVDDVAYINDSFATNPEPTLAAVRAIPQSKVLILGGSSKGNDFDELGKIIVESSVRGVVLIGDEADKIKNSLNKYNFSGAIEMSIGSMDAIVSAAMRMAEAGDSVILSPACASFGLFKNYKDRGDKFKIAVNKL